LLSIWLNLSNKMPLERSYFKHLCVLLQDLLENVFRIDLLDHKKANHKQSFPVVPPLWEQLVSSDLKGKTHPEKRGLRFNEGGDDEGSICSFGYVVGSKQSRHFEYGIPVDFTDNIVRPAYSFLFWMSAAHHYFTPLPSAVVPIPSHINLEVDSSLIVLKTNRKAASILNNLPERIIVHLSAGQTHLIAPDAFGMVGLLAFASENRLAVAVSLAQAILQRRSRIYFLLYYLLVLRRFVLR